MTAPFPPPLAMLVTLALLGGWRLLHPAPAALTQWDIDNAVKYTLGHTPPAARRHHHRRRHHRAFGGAGGWLSFARTCRRSWPRRKRKKRAQEPHQAADPDKDKAAKPRRRSDKDNSTKTPDGKATDEHPDSTGSGVVIDEKGDILTNLHVISSTDRWVVTFADGSKSDATHGQFPAGE